MCTVRAIRGIKYTCASHCVICGCFSQLRMVRNGTIRVLTTMIESLALAKNNQTRDRVHVFSWSTEPRHRVKGRCLLIPKRSKLGFGYALRVLRACTMVDDRAGSRIKSPHSKSPRTNAETSSLNDWIPSVRARAYFPLSMKASAFVPMPSPGSLL